MKEKMKVAVMQGPMKTEIIERDIPTPKEDEVLVKIEYVGVCGSDLHLYEHGGNGDVRVTPPFVLGHESAGTIVKIGKNVTHLKEGDRVALEPGRTCGHCEFCRTGRYNLCPDVEFFAAVPVDGVFSEYAVHIADQCFKLPENVSTLEGALIEPLAVGFHAARQGKAEIGKTAVVMGAGCIGLVTMMAMQAMGVTDITVCDIMPNRLKTAKKLGATRVINSKECDVVAEILKTTNGHGCDLVIDTAGQEITISQAIHITKKGATIVIVGYSPTGMVTVPMTVFLDKELTLKSIFRYRHIYPIAIDAVASGRIKVKDIVTDIFEFDEIEKGLEHSVKNKAEIVKSVIHIG